MTQDNAEDNNDRSALNDERLSIVVELILRGARLEDVQSTINKKFSAWELDAKQINSLFNQATQALSQQHANIELERARAALRLNNLFQRTMLIQDYKTALNAQKALTSMLSLHVQTQDATLQALIQEL